MAIFHMENNDDILADSAIVSNGALLFLINGDIVSGFGAGKWTFFWKEEDD